jgi:hypothetical protein
MWWLALVLPLLVLNRCCQQALYDYEPQAEGDLAIGEGDVVTLKTDQGDGWVKGMSLLPLHNHNL